MITSPTNCDFTLVKISKTVEFIFYYTQVTMIDIHLTARPTDNAISPTVATDPTVSTDNGNVPDSEPSQITDNHTGKLASSSTLSSK